jgi:hypothetical protein
VADYAAPADVTDRYPDLGVDNGRLAVLLDDAEAVLRARVPGLDRRVQQGRLDPGLVVKVLADAVARFSRNPDPSVSYDQRSVGPFSHAVTYKAGSVGFSDRELALLRAPSNPVGTIRLAVPRWWGA